MTLCDYAKEGLLCSIDKVYDEIKNGDDLLKKWAENDFDSYFHNTQQSEVIMSYGDMVRWAQQQPQFSQRAKDVFMEEKNADAWVLAFAHAKRLKIVTHEAFLPDVQKRIPIPNVCQAFSIDYCNRFELLKELRFNF